MPDTHQPDPTHTPVLEIDPTDVLTERVVNLLTPAFLAPAQGDENLARAAAFKALCDYYDHTPGDLLSVAQTILFGLATIEAAARSLAPGVSDATFLRLTGRANALARSEARARKALLDYSILQPQQTLPDWSPVLEPQEQAEEPVPQEAAPPPQLSVEAPVTSQSIRQPANSLRAQALNSVSYPAMIGSHPKDAAFPTGTPAASAHAALYPASRSSAQAALTELVAAE